MASAVAEQKVDTHYGAATSSGTSNQNYQQSLLSKPPSSSQKVRTPKVVEKSSATTNTLAQISKLIIWSFFAFGLIAVIMMFLQFADFDKLALMAILLLATMIFAIFGAWGVYKWGTVQEQIDLFKKENTKYESALSQLRNQKDRITDQVKKVQSSVGALEKNVDELQVSLKAYDSLREELKEIAGDNKDLNEMINDINSMFNGVHDAIIQNQRTAILQTYYDVQFRDNDQGLGENEYKRFLSRLDKETRARFVKRGDFKQHSKGDENIDLAEFQDLLEQILLDMEEDLLKTKTQ